MENTNELLRIVAIDTSQFSCNQKINCKYQERTISYATGVSIPEPGIDPEVQFKECCYKHFVFASLENQSDFKNDYSSFYHQIQVQNETVDFYLYHFETGNEQIIENDDFGQYFDFGYFQENQDFKGCLIEWKKVLNQFGEGNFKIIKRNTVAGIDIETNSITFTLKNYSTVLADHSVRIDVVMNGRLEKTNVDFTGLAWKHSLRVPGFFGRREPQFEEDNIVNKYYEKKQVSMMQTNEYKFQTNLIPSCLTNEIFDFILFANDIYMNDYNLNNHSYDFVKTPVKFKANENTDYKPERRKARLNLTFMDKFSNNIKRNFK